MDQIRMILKNKVPQSEYIELKEIKSLWMNVVDFFDRKQFSFKNSNARRTIGMAIAYTPMLLWIAFSRFFVCLMKAFCLQLQIPANNSLIINICPTHSTLKKVLDESTAELLMIIRRKSRNQPLFLSINAANNHMVKVIAF